jgi:hypothetical protein
MSALLRLRIRFLAPFYTLIPDWTSVHSLTYLSGVGVNSFTLRLWWNGIPYPVLSI